MSSTLLEYQLRIRDAADTTDVLTITSVRGGTNPYIVEPPNGDGAEFDPITGAYRSGSFTVRVADPITGGTSRLITSLLEDAGQRQQLASRPAYIEERVNGGAWTNLQAGIITGIRLASSAAWDIDVGDTSRATRNLVAFAPKRDAVDATKIESLATYLARWPNRGCILGGPVVGGFLGRADLGGWEMRVAAETIVFTASYTPAGGSPITTPAYLKYLEFVAGYGTPDFTRTTDLGELIGPVNAVMGTRAQFTVDSMFPDDLPQNGWGGGNLVVQVGNQYFAADTISGFGGTVSNDFLYDEKRGRGLYIWDYPTRRLTVGAGVVRVRVFDALPSDRCPIYWSGHPVDLWAKLCDEAGLSYDATAASACKDALGRGLRINLRITATEAWGSFVESVLYGPFGFSARTDPSGRLVPFATRIVQSALPGVVLTQGDVPQQETVLFDLSEPESITKVTVDQTNLLLSIGAGPSPPLDGIDTQAVSVIRTSGDPGGPVQREQQYSIPGFVDTGSGAYEPAFVDALARGIFDRYGRGRLAGELTALRTGAGAGVTLGQELIVALPAMPNHNKRYGDDNTVGGRVLQIVRLTRGPEGARLKLIDSGPNAQLASPTPTLTIAAGAGPGGAFLSITNAAALNTAGLGVRLRWAQTTGAVPAAADYTDVGAYDPGKVPAAAIALPTAIPGRTVWVIARSEQPGLRPSAFTAAVSVATPSYSAPSALTATPDATDGTRCALAWAIGAGAAALVVDVFVRATADPVSADVLRMTLDAGSIGYTLDDLVQSTNYTASVQHRDRTTGAVSAKTTVAFTTSAAVATLAVPTSPVGIVGSTDAAGIAHTDGTYGLNVTAVVLPSLVEFWEALETAVGSGAYGTAVLVKTTPGVSGGPTAYRSVAPNDGLRRRLTARHARGGTTSSFTAAVVVNPWGAVQQPPSPGPSLVVTATSGNPMSIAYSGTYDTILLSIDNGSFSAPAASPISVTLDGSNHTYTFKATKDGIDTSRDIAVPATPPTGTVPTFSSLATSENTTTDQFTLSWVCSDSSVQIEVWVREDHAHTGNDWALVATKAAGSTSHAYPSMYDLIVGAPTALIEWYVRAISSGGTVLSTSIVKSFPFNHV